MGFQEIAGCIRSIHLKTFVRTAVMRGQAQVMEDGAYIKELGIVWETMALAIEGGEEKDAEGVIVDEFCSMFQ